MKKIPLLIILFLFSLPLVLADAEEFEEAERLINSGIDCNELTADQLEIMGDYIMEQMHPGQSHEIMDRMMGGEGSESLRQAHINMAYRFYCNENFGGYGMMGNVGYGMMQGFMGNFGYNNMMGYGMMGGLGYGYGILFWILQILIIVILILVIVWLYQKISRRK